MMMIGKRHLRAGLLLLAATAAVSFTLPEGRAQATEIRFVVNDAPVTSYDIDRRAAFLRLQRQSGNLGQKATDQMIEQTLRLQEMKRLKIDVPDQQVEESYKRFAASNKLSANQLDTMLSQSGVTSAHFKEFIRTQIGWGRVLQTRFRTQEKMSEQDVVQQMLQQGGSKPTATEYMLQQVIFVVPASQRSGLMGKRKREAQSMRDRFRNCDSTRDFAKGLIDVTVRDLGRILEPELPPEWKDGVKALKVGSATKIRETERGVEFIGVCSTREVSDDRVAKMVFQNEKAENASTAKLTEEVMADLRKKARIIKR